MNIWLNVPAMMFIFTYSECKSVEKIEAVSEQAHIGTIIVPVYFALAVH